MGVKNLSGTIVVGGVSQLLAPSNLKRHGLMFQNRSGSTLYINLFGPASTDGSTGSYAIASGQAWNTPFFEYNADETTFGGYEDVYIYGATTGQQFACMEW